MSFDLCYMQFVYIFFFRALRFQLERKDHEMKILVSRNSFFPVSFLVLPLNCYSYILLSVKKLERTEREFQKLEHNIQLFQVLKLFWVHRKHEKPTSRIFLTFLEPRLSPNIL